MGKSARKRLNPWQPKQFHHIRFQLIVGHFVRGFELAQFARQMRHFFKLIAQLIFGCARANNRDLIGIANMGDELFAKLVHLVVAALVVFVLIGDGHVLIGVDAAMVVGFNIRPERCDGNHIVKIGFDQISVRMVDPNGVQVFHGGE